MLLDLRKGSVVLSISACSFKYGYIAYVKLVSMEKLSTKDKRYMYTKWEEKGENDFLVKTAKSFYFWFVFWHVQQE